MGRHLKILSVVTALFLVAPSCSSSEGSQEDAAAGDLFRDIGQDIAPRSDLGQIDHPRGEQHDDAFSPLAGFGALSGQCGVLDEEEWAASKPFFFVNTIDVGSAAFDEKLLSPGGQVIFSEGNLGGSSIHSEIFSYEVLHRCELATLLKTEAKIGYKDMGGKKTDLLVSIDGYKVGVSVTRAVHFPKGELYTASEAETLLKKKLSDIQLSEANAAAADAWGRSMLHVIAWDAQHAQVIEAAFAALEASVKAKTILVVTVTDGTDDYIY